MAKYLYQVGFTQAGAQGLLQEGGTSLREHVRGLVESIGGKLESLYFMWGADDVLVIADFTDPATAAALALNVAASGSLTVRTTPLIEPEDIDGAAKIPVQFRPLGG